MIFRFWAHINYVQTDKYDRYHFFLPKNSLQLSSNDHNEPSRALKTWNRTISKYNFSLGSTVKTNENAFFATQMWIYSGMCSFSLSEMTHFHSFEFTIMMVPLRKSQWKISLFGTKFRTESIHDKFTIETIYRIACKWLNPNLSFVRLNSISKRKIQMHSVFE